MAKRKGIPEPTAVELCKRAEALFNGQERKSFEVLWQDLSTYLLPNQHRDFSTQTVQTKGRKLTTEIYDSCGYQANYELACIMHSTLTPPSLRWSKLEFVEEKDKKDPDANAWLESCLIKMHEAMNSSNFSQEFGTAFNTNVALGNAAVLIEEGDESEGGKFSGFSCRGWHLASFVMVENKYGIVDTVFRKLKMSGKKAMERWPDTLPKEVIEKYQQRPDEECEYMHVIMPRNQVNVKRMSTGKYAPGKAPFASIYIEVNSKEIVEDSDYIEFPLVVFRGDKSEGETYGRGPGSMALPDVKTLNKIVKTNLQAMALAARPPVLVEHRNLVSDINVAPGAQIVVKSLDQIREFVTQARFDVTERLLEKLENKIRKSYFLDKLVIPPRDTRGEMTAYEVAQLRVDMQRVLGPLVDRLQSETLGPAVKRMFGIMLRGGAFDPIPRSVRGKPIKVEYVNPISKSQNAEDLTAMQQWYQFGGLLGQLGRPEALDLIDVDESMRHSAKVLNVPSKILSKDDSIKQIREQRAKMQRQLMQQEAAVKQADVAAKSAKANPQNNQSGGSGLA